MSRGLRKSFKISSGKGELKSEAITTLPRSKPGIRGNCCWEKGKIRATGVPP
ncbi:MAG: hypothetical protein ACKOPK_24210 [Dolichospermum sp.]